jgi:HSP20 family protein
MPALRSLFDFSDRWPEMVESSDMRLEEFEDDGVLVVRAELPGIDPEKDVDITMADHTLRIRAERRAKSETKGKDSYRTEFRYGSFVRSIALPADVSADDVHAHYSDGVLEIRIPKSEREAAKKIPVERGSSTGG